MDNKILYCNRCLMKEGDPGVSIGEDGLCNQCSKKEVKGAVINMRDIIKSALEFQKYISNKDRHSGCGDYDCLLMLSGGKDSINILDEIVTTYGAKVLAFSVNHPFESNVALKNTELCVKKLNIEHILFTPNIEDYSKLLSCVFNSDNENSTSCGGRATYKAPCIACTAFMQLKSFIFAMKLKIPYVLYCADPFQMAHIQKNIKMVVDDLVGLIGKEQCIQLFGNDIEVLMDADMEYLPKLIYPYAIVNDYDADKIVNKLIEKGLYEGSPIETHCSLFSLLNYYSYKNFNMNFYAPELAYSVRDGKTSRDEAIEYVEKFKNIILDIAIRDDIENNKKYILDTIRLVYKTDEQAKSMYDKVVALRENMKKMNVNV